MNQITTLKVKATNTYMSLTIKSSSAKGLTVEEFEHEHNKLVESVHEAMAASGSWSHEIKVNQGKVIGKK